MPIYLYEHPTTKEIFEDIRPFSKAEDPFIAPDGVECKRVFCNSAITVVDKNAEAFEKASDYAKKVKPKYVRFRDGHRERYDPTKHC